MLNYKAMVGVGLIAVAVGGCIAERDAHEPEVDANDTNASLTDVSDQPAPENVGVAEQDSLGGVLCDAGWSLVAGAGCGVIHAACVAGGVVTIGAATFPCELAAAVACGSVAASAAAAAHNCPE